jgi:hypothetical protein
MNEEDIFNQPSTDDLIQWDEQRQQEEDEQQWYDFLRDKEERFGRIGLEDPFLEEKFTSEELEQIINEQWDDVYIEEAFEDETE